MVNVDFDYEENGSGTYSGQGAYSDPGNNFWNSINALNVNSPTVLKASDGSTDTSITVSFSESLGYANISDGGGAGPLASGLMFDYFYASSNPISFSIGGLTASATYQFYFYSAAGSDKTARNRQAVFTLDGVSQNVNGYSSATENSELYTSFVEGDNYLVFTATPTGTSLNGSFKATVSEAEFNGLQIVQVSPVPEPASYALLASMATLGFVILRRRHQSRQ